MCCIYIFYFLEFIPSGKFKFVTKKIAYNYSNLQK
jgi:hypothetical protein